MGFYDEEKALLPEETREFVDRLTTLIESKNFNVSTMVDGTTAPYEPEEGKKPSMYFCISQFSPNGCDWNMEVQGRDEHELIESIREFCESYNPVAEGMLWVDEEGQGKNGAVGDIRDIIADFEDMKERAEELLSFLEENEE